MHIGAAIDQAARRGEAGESAAGHEHARAFEGGSYRDGHDAFSRRHDSTSRIGGCGPGSTPPRPIGIAGAMRIRPPANPTPGCTVSDCFISPVISIMDF